MKYCSKRFLSILLMVCILLPEFPSQASAVECANYTLTYEDNGDSTVAITGITVAEGFEEAEFAVEIPETIDGKTVTKIDGGRSSAFAPYSITSVSIPATVTEIEGGAFMSCHSLTQVTFAEGSAPGFGDAGSSDRNGVFTDCTALTSIELPAGTTKLGTHLFSGCKNLTSVNLPQLTQIAEIPFRAFENCALSTVELPGNINHVAQDAFSANYICTGFDAYNNEIRTYTIQSITLNEGLREIDSNAFSGATITSLVLPNSLKTIGQNAFSGCYQLAAITWPDNKDFTEINGFDHCTSLPDSIFESLPGSVTSIGAEAFSGCRFTALSLPGTVDTIGERAFSYNYSLKTVELREGLQSIGAAAFSGCNGTDNGEYMEGLLNASIVVPETVTYIGAGAFSVPYNSNYADKANPGLTLKFLNRDLELRDESGGFIPILGSVTYAAIYGYHYRSDGTTETDLYAYMQSLMNQTGCTYTWKDLSGTQPVSVSYTISGTVTPATATLLVEKGDSRMTQTIDENGAFSFSVKNDENIKLTFYADGYIKQTFARAAGSTGDWNLETVNLSLIPVNKTITVALSDSDGKNLYSFDGLSLFLKAGEKTLTENTDYILQFPYIILKDTVSVTKDTTLTLTARTDESLKRSGATATTTFAEPSLELVLPAWGNVVIPTVSKFVGGHNILIFDAEKKLAEYGTISSTKAGETSEYTSDKLKAGSYTAIIFNQNPYLSVVPTLSGLESCGITENTDYKKISFTVRDKTTTTLDTLTVPLLNTKKFRTIVDTDFSCIRLDDTEPLTGIKFRARVFYGFADKAVTNGILTMNLPSDADIGYIGNETGKLNPDSAANGYTRSGNTLTIPVKRNRGVIFMDLTITGTGSRVISAALSDGKHTSPLGSSAFDCYTTRLALPSEHFESRTSAITASIKAKPQTQVDAYLNGEKKGTVITDKLGGAYFDFTPPSDTAIGQKLTISTQTPEGDGSSAVIRNFATDAVVKEFYFVQHGIKNYVVKDSALTKNLTYSYYYVKARNDECKDWSFSATINGKSPLDKDLTSVTLTMKTGDTMNVPLYLSGQTTRDDGSTDYLFTGMVTLEHPGVSPAFFNNSRVPVRLDLNYASIFDENTWKNWPAYTGTQTLMADITANVLSEEEKKKIEDSYTNPWTPEVIAAYTQTTEDYLTELYYRIQGNCADPDNPTDAEQEAAKAAVQEDVKTVMEPFTTTNQDMLDEMANMLFGDEYMVEIDEKLITYANTDEERQWVRDYQSALLNLQNSVDNYCDYLSAAWLLDKNLTDYADGLEIAEEAGITVAPAFAEQIRSGTAENVTINKVEQAENSDIYYAYDSSGALVYTIDTSRQLEKVLAHKDAIQNGNVSAALPGNASASNGSSTSRGTKGSDTGSAWTADSLETVSGWVGGFWAGALATGIDEKQKSMRLSAEKLAKLSARADYLDKWGKRWVQGELPYVDKETYDMFMNELKIKNEKISAATKTAPKLEAIGKGLNGLGAIVSAGQAANSIVNVTDRNRDIEDWEGEVERKEKLYHHYMKLETKDCETFPTKFQCGDALMQCTDAGRKLAGYNRQLRNFATVDAVASGLAAGSAFIPGLGWGVSLGIGAAGTIWGMASDGAKTELQQKIAKSERDFSLGEMKAKKYCKIDRQDCPDDDSSSRYNGSKASGNYTLGSGCIGSDMRACLDPSGLIYEAVESNPLSGVTATIWFSTSQDGTGAVKWDAENYGGQRNPQTTDTDGMYAWFVPDGYWKVTFTKDGYTEAETAWLEVPPPRLDVNMGLVSKAKPAVQSINAYPDYIEIIFTQYMRITDELRISDGYRYKWAEKTPVNAESNLSYSKVLRLIPHKKANIGDTVSVSVDGAKNYAGASLPGYSSGNLTVVPRPDKLVLNYEDQISVHIGETPIPRATIRVVDSDGNPIPGLKLLAETTSDVYASVSPVKDTTGEDGIATFSVEGLLPGTTRLTLSVENTPLHISIPVLVTNTEHRPERPTAKIGSISLTAASPKENFVTVRSGETMTLSCKTDGAVIYYTTDDTCPCQNTASRTLYTDPVPITENTKFRIAAYKDGMDYSERLNITVTVDDTRQSEEIPATGTPQTTEPTNSGSSTATPPAKPESSTSKPPVKPENNTSTTPVKPNGNTATESLSPDSDTPTEPVTPKDDTPSESAKPNRDRPTKNQDSQKGGSNLLLWLAILLLSCAGLFGIILFFRKKKEEKESS